MTEAPPDLTGRIVDGFRIECLLGRGGMGEVWKAWDPRLEREVAIKMLSDSDATDREGVLRFEREAKAVSAISHPNIAHVYATGRFGERPYYVMELIAGRSLGKVLEKEGRIPGRRSLDYLRQAAEGLAAAHARGVVHRDVKPDNLMVDAEDRVKVVDFGLARRVEGDDSLTQANMVVGTPRYMAPEQATGGVADHRSDIYALGASFYHLFSGQAPFEAPTPVAVMLRHVHDPLVPLRERVPQVPVGVSAIVEKMMAKEPAQRYQRYEELIADVKKALSGATPRVVAASTVSLPTPPRPAHAASEPRSGKPAWAVGGLALAILAGIVFLAFRAGNEWKRAAAPAPAAAKRPVSLPRAVAPPAGTEDAPAADRGDRPAPADVPSDAPPFLGAIRLAFHARSVATLRKLSTALTVYANTREEAGLPATLDEIARDVDRWGVHPKELKDGWGTDIAYERLSPTRFRLASAGADRTFGSADDIVLEDGVIVKGEIDERAMEEQVRRMREK